MRSLFPDPRKIEHALGYGHRGGFALMPLPNVEEASIPKSLEVALGGSFAIEKFKRQIRDKGEKGVDGINTVKDNDKTKYCK